MSERIPHTLPAFPWGPRRGHGLDVSVFVREYEPEVLVAVVRYMVFGEVDVDPRDLVDLEIPIVDLDVDALRRRLALGLVLGLEAL